MKNYLQVNKNNWNSKVDLHAASDFYDVKSFLKRKSSLNDIELKLLGNIKGKKLIHLQCHFGLDTLSLGMKGAYVTGVDFSDKAISKAKELSETSNIKADFYCCDLYKIPETIKGKFDIVFTSYGVLGWLPDLKKWAKIVSGLLKKNGQLILVEFHPAVWMFDNSFNKIKYSYFNNGAIVEVEKGSYANRNETKKYKSVSWNHSLDEVFNSLKDAGLSINTFKEFNYSPYNCLRGMEQAGKKKYRIKKFKDNLPLVYALKAIK